ncbi:hypothetical protein [Streptomyces sp. SAI-127]|uniref:hypothetical protein n=1 Tax=Streptomyces sp. SAI-127 TaxID=2940543 RepID=UPI002475C9F8|nr:hypothetical protein [Streptomyces sp. SAI-127]MDH6489685.1 hypothetical protein [Streptomyces sp. SAI-127]
MLDIPGLPLPDFEPAPEPTIYHVLFPDGVLGRVTVTGSQKPVLAGGAKLVTQEVYDMLRAQMLEAHEARVAEMLAAEEDVQRQQYEDLRAVGIPETTARSLSGYGGQAAAEDASAAAQAPG